MSLKYKCACIAIHVPKFNLGTKVELRSYLLQYTQQETVTRSVEQKDSMQMISTSSDGSISKF